jgi:hypothetical protein
MQIVNRYTTTRYLELWTTEDCKEEVQSNAGKILGNTSNYQRALGFMDFRAWFMLVTVRSDGPPNEHVLQKKGHAALC